ncbi:MAG: hypothetical protein M3Y45_02395 [Actinomycetota bacterium]|nr:hypothetical protein [Actinomycetota bacterium]
MNNDVLPANDAIEYVLSAYIFFLLLILVYIGILGAKFQRISRDIAELTDDVESGRTGNQAGKAAAEPPAETAGEPRV